MIQKNKLFITAGMKTSDVIINNPYLMLMLEHFNIPMVVQDKTIEQLCVENNIHIELFLTIANLFNDSKSTSTITYSSAAILQLITYLRNSHQYYIAEKYPQIQDYIKQIQQQNNHPEILMIEKFFDTYFVEVTEHLNYENKVVFPYVLNLDKQLSNNPYDKGISGYSVTDYKEHHDDIEEKLTDLKNLLIKYLPQQNDHLLRRKLLFCLFELEYDLHIHSLIEDALLIPLVMKMEQLTNQ